jgi:peptidoglycan/LPS O-acetylase OafA/YrhL
MTKAAIDLVTLAEHKPDGVPQAGEAGAKPATNRVIGLDVLRFTAVTLVIFRHLESFKGSPAWLGQLTIHLGEGGWTGVDIFFVLSGFLVSGLLFREWQQHQTLSVGRFLWRRGWKIYPSFWFFLLGMVVFSYCLHWPVNWRNMLGELLFLQNYWANAFNHTWSLAVEEHFYFMLALGFWLLFRWRRRAGDNPYRFLPPIFLIVASLCLVVRIVSNHIFPVGRVRLLFFCTHIRIDSLLFGVLLSYFWHFTFTPRHHAFFYRWRFGLLLMGAGLLAPMFFFEPFGVNNAWVRIYGFILCYLAGGAWLIAYIKIFENTRFRLAHFLAYLGASSYSVYLWHEMGIFVGSNLFPGRSTSALAWICYCLACQSAAWVIGLAMARLVEIPMLKLRDRWFPSRSSGPLQVDAAS